MNNIPPLNISVTKGAINGQVVEVVDYEEYCKNRELYSGRSDVAIPSNFKGKEILLPIKGDFPTSGNPMSPGVYNSGCIDFFVDPEEAFVDRYVSKNTITMSNNTDIKELIKAEEESKKLDEAFITSPDSVTTIPIKQTDQPEMVCLKKALNAKHIDIDKYAARFGDNFPNDKRQLKGSSATLNIIKRYCDNCDMEAILILRDKNENVPNPMNQEIVVSLTEPMDELENDESSSVSEDTE